MPALPSLVGINQNSQFRTHFITYILMTVLFASRWWAQTHQFNHRPILPLTYPRSQDFNIHLQATPAINDPEAKRWICCDR